MLFLLIACGDPKESSAPIDSSSTDTATTAEVEAPWPHCPQADAWVGDTTWTGSLQATNNALYCSASNETRTLVEELQYKAKLRIIEGSYPVPVVEGSAEMTLPICTLRADSSQQAEMSGNGTTEVSPNSFGGTTYSYLEGQQPLVAADDSHWTLSHTLILVGPDGQAPASLILDGHENDAEAGSGASFVLYPEGNSPYDISSMPFYPCSDPTWVDNIHTITFEGGTITLELFLGDDPIITAPGMFRKATGTLDGQSFEISDFFQLVYRPGHHHMDRHFAVIFNAPIDDACALMIEDIDTQTGTTTARVSTASCVLSPLETRTVQSEDFQLGN